MKTIYKVSQASVLFDNCKPWAFTDVSNLCFDSVQELKDHFTKTQGIAKCIMYRFEQVNHNTRNNLGITTIGDCNKDEYDQLVDSIA